MINRAIVIEWSATFGSAIILVLAFGTVGRIMDYKAESASVLQGPSIGSVISLPGTDWARNRTTLIIAMQVGCRWCEASADFYRDLIQSDSTSVFHPVAILPQPVEQSRRFLLQLGLQIPDVRQFDIGKLGVHSTPTLILADAQGKVEVSWVGKLSPRWETAVFKKIGIRRQARTSVPREK